MSRRTALHTLLGAGAFWAVPSLWAQSPGANAGNGRLVVVFLRGAYDGLSALVPHGDTNYYALRPNIALPRPDGTAQTTLALDSTFGLHPALAPLMPLWKQGVLAALPAAGSPDPTRSHFDAQHHWEIGMPGKSSNAPGWLNTLAGFKAVAPENSAQAATKSIAIGVGEANPQILSGSAPVQLVPRGQAATRQGALGDERTRDAVMRLYAGQDTLSQAFRSGADSRMQTAQTLSAEMSDPAMASREMQAANNGAGTAQGLLLDAQHLGTLMRQDRRLRLGFLSAGGWDTHANQGSVTGALATNLGNLASTLVQMRRDFSQPGTWWWCAVSLAAPAPKTAPAVPTMATAMPCGSWATRSTAGAGTATGPDWRRATCMRDAICRFITTFAVCWRRYCAAPRDCRQASWSVCSLDLPGTPRSTA